MTASDAFWLTLAIAGGTALTAVTWRLDKPIRSAGSRRTWLRCLIRSSSR